MNLIGQVFGEEFIIRHQIDLDDEPDELQQFLQLSPLRNPDPLNFWKEKKEQFPYLYKVAIGLLSMPTSSADVERLFSKAKQDFWRRQLRTGDELIESRMLIIGNKELFVQFFSEHWLEYFIVD